jgi:hypothetical protein
VCVLKTNAKNTKSNLLNEHIANKKTGWISYFEIQPVIWIDFVVSQGFEP